MNMLFILVFISLVFLFAGVSVFFWAIRSRQFKELEMQAYSILKNDEYDNESIEEISNQSQIAKRDSSNQL